MSTTKQTKPADPSQLERLLSAEELSAIIGVPVLTLAHWRRFGRGPQALRLGKHVRYDPAEVRRWLTEQACA